MGKKNKNNAIGAENIGIDTRKDKKRKHVNNDSSNTDLSEPVHEKINKKYKKNVPIDEKQDADVSKQTKKNDKHLEVDTTEVNPISEPKKVKSKKKDKNMDADNTEVNPVIEPKKVKRKNRDKNMDADSESVSKNVKIIFKGDEHGEDSSLKANGGNVTSKKKFLSGEEAAVTEEEIDKFCDELDEEDNVQFDNWVKLIEEKLHPTKKNKTS